VKITFTSRRVCIIFIKQAGVYQALAGYRLRKVKNPEA
jgi:hypothetical protein